MAEEYDKHDRMCRLKDNMVDWATSLLQDGKPQNAAEVQAMGEVIDMVKDMAEAEKLCREADYYRSVHKSMEGYGEDPRMGYPRRRNAMGQYSRTGRSGYDDGFYPMEDDRMRIERERSGRMGYTHDRFAPQMRMDEDNRGMREDWEDPRYSRPFNQYRMAKRHFTETKSDKDRQEMKDYANEHVAESLSTLREIWDSADQDLRVRMKSDLTKLIGDMKP